MNAFSHLSLDLLNNIEARGYFQPTEIQEQSIPILLNGHDLIGIAQTGTGKTAAFSLPIIERFKEEYKKMRPHKCRALILAPTRELASQIHKEILECYRGCGLKAAVLFGGVKSHNQIKALKRGPDILVATPGRLEDLMEQKAVILDQVNTLVLDEADRMLDMGFLPAIKRIISRIPETRQTMLFSATMPDGVLQLTQSLLQNPVRVEVKAKATPVEAIEQILIPVQKKEKFPLLKHLVQQSEVNQSIIFCRTKYGADRLSKKLKKQHFSCDTIHGNRSQQSRAKVIAAFKAGELKLLVATDIAARGIDVEGVSHVFNFDMPTDPDSYIHRIGRTGRAGRKGVAISFCNEDEEHLKQAVEKNQGNKIPMIKQNQLNALKANYTPPGQAPHTKRLAPLTKLTLQQQKNRNRRRINHP